MLMHPGDKLHVITRRQFEGDLRRHFCGEVQSVDSEIVRLKGYAFIYDSLSSEFRKREDLRIRIFSLVDAGIIIHILPAEVNPEEVEYHISEDNHLVVTDGRHFTMDIQEFY